VDDSVKSVNELLFFQTMHNERNEPALTLARSSFSKEFSKSYSFLCTVLLFCADSANFLNAEVRTIAIVPDLAI